MGCCKDALFVAILSERWASEWEVNKILLSVANILPATISSAWKRAPRFTSSSDGCRFRVPSSLHSSSRRTHVLPPSPVSRRLNTSEERACLSAHLSCCSVEAVNILCFFSLSNFKLVIFNLSSCAVNYISEINNRRSRGNEKKGKGEYRRRNVHAVVTRKKKITEWLSSSVHSCVRGAQVLSSVSGGERISSESFSGGV